MDGMLVILLYRLGLMRLFLWWTQRHQLFKKQTILMIQETKQQQLWLLVALLQQETQVLYTIP